MVKIVKLFYIILVVTLVGVFSVLFLSSSPLNYKYSFPDIQKPGTNATKPGTNATGKKPRTNATATKPRTNESKSSSGTIPPGHDPKGHAKRKTPKGQAKRKTTRALPSRGTSMNKKLTVKVSKGTSHQQNVPTTPQKKQNSSSAAHIKLIHAPPEKHYVDMRGAWGRLGNHLFFYASLRGIGAAINFTPIIPRNDPIFSLFNINTSCSIGRIPLTNIEQRGERGIGIFTEELMKAPAKSVNMTIYGYFQTWKYFKDIDKEIRKELTLKEKVAHQVEQIFRDLNITSRIKVGIHARRGDFINRAGTKVPDAAYYHKAMDKFRKLVDKPVFIVCSEDKAWVTKHIVADDVLVVHENYEVDFGTLITCNHTIISSGTFGWWAAYLTNGITIYFKDFPSLPLLRTFDLKDYYPHNWIGMGN